MAINFITHPKDSLRLGNFLIDSLADTQWTEFRAAIAFIKRSGTKHIKGPLSEFVNRGGRVVITAGVDVGGTTVEGLEDLLFSLDNRGELFVFHNANSSTFHPKIYLFKNDRQAKILIGSANMTEGGLFTNYEAGLYILLNLDSPTDSELLHRIESTLNEWSTEQDGICFRVTADLIERLTLENQITDEAVSQAQRRASTVVAEIARVRSMFRGQSVPPAPRVVMVEAQVDSPISDDDTIIEDTLEAETLTVAVPTPTTPQSGTYRIFLITLQKTDVGVGQTTSGKQRRSPEIFIPLICRDYDPDFWGWPNSFVSDVNWTGPLDRDGRGKMDRANVMVRLAGTTIPVTIWYNPDKKDIRIRSEHIRSAGAIGDILYLERADGTSGFSYYVEIIPQGTVRYSEHIRLCTKSVRNSRKLWNYL